MGLLSEKYRNFLSLSLSMDVADLAELFSLTKRAVRYRQQSLLKKINKLQDK